MLPQISAALAKWIRPVTANTLSSTAKATLDREKSSKDFKKFQPKKEATPAKQAPAQTSPKDVPAEKSKHLTLVRDENNKSLSVAETFLMIFQRFRNQGAFIRTLALRTYQSSFRKQKKASRIRKGVIMDQKAE